MGKVAVAGGSSGLGRTMVDALRAAKTHDFIVLSRTATTPDTRAVSYTDTEALVRLLESEQINTVISYLRTTVGSTSPKLKSKGFFLLDLPYMCITG